MRRNRFVPAAVLLLAVPVLLAALPAAAEAAAPQAAVTEPAGAPQAEAGCQAPATTPATLQALLAADGNAAPQTAPQTALESPDDGLRLATASCKCLLSQVGQPCHCFGCAYEGNCVTLAGRPRCLTICAD
jgi:hypothetical protein